MLYGLTFRPEVFKSLPGPDGKSPVVRSTPPDDRLTQRSPAGRLLSVRSLSLRSPLRG